MRRASLLYKWTYCCCADLAVYTTAISVDAKALVFVMLSVMSTACFVGVFVDVCLWAVSLGQGNKGWNRLLRLKVLSALILHIIVYLLPRVCMSDAASACASRLCSAYLNT